MGTRRSGWILLIGLLLLPVGLAAEEVIDSPELFKALIEGDGATVKSFIDEGINPSAFIKPRHPGYENDGLHPMVVWAIVGGIDATRVLVEAGARLNEPLYEIEGWVPWHWAIYPLGGASVETLRYVVDHGADLELTDGSGNTALMVSILRGAFEKAIILIEAGAEVNTREGGDRGDTSPRTPLICLLDDAPHAIAISRERREEITRLLLQGGADPDATTTPSSATPLSFAARNGHTEVVRLLLSYGAEVDATDVGSWSRTALHWAAERGQFDAVKVLVEAGADLSIEDGFGRTPLDNAQRFRGRQADKDALINYLTDAVASR